MINKNIEFSRILHDFELESSNYHGASLSVYFITSEGPLENHRFEQPSHAIMLWQYYGTIGSDESIKRFSEQQPTKFGLTGAKYSAFAVFEGEGTDLFIRMATRAGNMLPDDDPGQSVPPDIKKRLEKIEPGQKPAWVFNSTPAATWIRHLLNFISTSNPTRLWGDRLQLDPFATSLAALEHLAGNKLSIELSKVAKQEGTRVDSIVKKAKNHTFISVLIIVGMIVVGLANFTDAISKIANFVSILFLDEEKPKINIDLQFPYERSSGLVKQNTQYPELTITNNGHVNIAPIVVDASMLIFTPSLDTVEKHVIMTRSTHGHLIFEPELKAGLSTKTSLPGVKSWTQPVAYDIRVEMFRGKDNKKFIATSSYLVYQNKIEVVSAQTDSKTQKIRSAIKSFLDSPDANEKETWTLTQPIKGVWIPSHSEPGIDVHVNKDGSAHIKTQK